MRWCGTPARASVHSARCVRRVSGMTGCLCTAIVDLQQWQPRRIKSLTFCLVCARLSSTHRPYCEACARRTHKITHTTGIVNRTLARLHGVRWHEPCGCSANVLAISVYTPLLYYMCGVRVQHTRARNKPWTYMGAALSECFGKALHALPRCLPRTSVNACTTGNSGGKLANCTHTHTHIHTHTHRGGSGQGTEPNTPHTMI